MQKNSTSFPCMEPDCFVSKDGTRCEPPPGVTLTCCAKRTEATKDKVLEAICIKLDASTGERCLRAYSHARHNPDNPEGHSFQRISDEQRYTLAWCQCGHAPDLHDNEQCRGAQVGDDGQFVNPVEQCICRNFRPGTSMVAQMEKAQVFKTKP